MNAQRYYPVLLVLMISALLTSASAQNLQSYSFYGQNGSYPSGGLVRDNAGNFYGVTASGGGAANAGIVYEINSTFEATLYTFQGNSNGNSDGANPIGNLIFDSAGNLYGVTTQGGISTCTGGCGTVFELSPPSSPGGAWTESVLYRFQQNSSTDGAFPMAGLVFDTGGNLYGTTEVNGGVEGVGTVFELSPPSEPGGVWTETLLHTFQNYPTDGAYPVSQLILDSAGNLYGTTQNGGANTYGCVFEVSPPSQPDGAWSETVLHSFYKMDGTNPMAGLTWGPGGALFGVTTIYGPNSWGTLFRMYPTGQGTWNYYVVFGFSSGDSPTSPVVFASPTTLYGTTNSGGIVYEISYSGGKATFTELANPGASDAQLVLSQGAIYGTTSSGGAYFKGQVYRLSR